MVAVLRGERPANGFPADQDHGGPGWYRRCNRAHLNCVENLPVFGAVVLVGAASSGTFATWWMGKVGGSSDGPPASPIARRIQKRLHDRPVMAVAMLRFFTRFAPPAHMLLALAGVTPVQNFVGTLVGFAPRVIVAALFLEPVVDWFLAE